MAATPPRAEVDEILYSTLRAIHQFERDLEARYGLGYTEICLLQFLRRRAMPRIGEAARALELPVFRTTRLVQRLVASGLVDRAADPADRRAVRIGLSGKGLALVERLEAENYALIGGNVAGLSDGEAAAFVLVGRRLGTILGIEGRGREPAGR